MSSNPVDALTEPDGSDPVPDMLENAVGLSFLSPSFYIQQFCTSVIKSNPWDWAAEQLSGDWDGVKRAGNSVQNLADYNDHFSAAIHESLRGVEPWRGIAADNARGYFQKFGDAVGSQASPLRSIAEQIDQISLAMYELSKAVGDALSAITDMAIIALIEIAAAEALALTGVGVIGSGAAMGAATLQVLMILEKWGEVLQYWTTTWSVVQALMSGITGSLAGSEFIDLPSLPETSYDHPGA
ncbi:hypothetical protein R1X32_40070 [Rhodococcus opacus]|uniref:hypothetical protein n=1 Tax=Rhodococcus opacus TaxID=37919 RepID=UPI00146A91F9|nr:hypothetical protein [Rhodococcus opacus]MDV6245579.1 hypothetical protein [Rhodococcus opacus]WKN54260.1 hypothetical protein HJ581_0010905 [Rhodococcus opacus]